MSLFGTIYADGELSHRAKTVYMYLRDRADAEGKQELMDTAVRAIRIGAGSTVTLQLVNGQTVSGEEGTK